MNFRHVALAVAALGLSACTTDGVGRNEGVSSRAGNAVASNTVLQMVDPWPYGVDDTDLETPAERPGAAVAADEGGGKDDGGTMKNSGSDD